MSEVAFIRNLFKGAGLKYSLLHVWCPGVSKRCFSGLGHTNDYSMN